MAEPMRVIEAALFMSPDPISIGDLASLAGLEEKTAAAMLDRLRKQYEERQSGLIIFEDNGRFGMRPHPDIEPIVSRLAADVDISRGALRALALISKKEPLKQSTLVKALGTRVYEYVPELVEKGFVDAAKSGTTRILRTTEKFKQYFTIKG